MFRRVAIGWMLWVVGCEGCWIGVVLVPFGQRHLRLFLASFHLYTKSRSFFHFNKAVFLQVILGLFAKNINIIYIYISHIILYHIIYKIVYYPLPIHPSPPAPNERLVPPDVVVVSPRHRRRHRRRHHHHPSSVIPHRSTLYPKEAKQHPWGSCVPSALFFFPWGCCVPSALLIVLRVLRLSRSRRTPIYIQLYTPTTTYNYLITSETNEVKRKG